MVDTLGDEKKNPYSQEDAEKAIFKNLQERLAKNDVKFDTFPDDYLELHRIVDPKSEAGKNFQREMDTLLKFLVPDPEFTEVTTKHPISFLLSDMKEANGYIIPTPNQTIICLDKELFNRCDNLNQLAYVLLHELSHLKIYDVFGEGANSQTEEGACDVRPLRKMSELGLDMNQAKVIMRKLGEKPVPSWMALVDAHPLPHYRVDVIETAIGGLLTLQGQSADPKLKKIMPMPDSLKKAVENAGHESFIDLQCKENNFNTMSPDAQLDQVAKWLPAFEISYPNRALDAGKAVEKINADPMNAAHTSKLTNIIDQLLDNPHALGKLYETLENKLYGDVEEKDYPAGKISGIAAAMTDFIYPEDTTDIKNNAKRLMEAYAAQPSKYIRWKPMELSYFELESSREYTRQLREAKREGTEVHLPWHDHIEQMKYKPDSNVIRALWLSGVFDPRLLEMATAEDCKWYMQEIGEMGFLESQTTLSMPVSPLEETHPSHVYNMLIDGSGCLRRIIDSNIHEYFNDYYRKIKETHQKLINQQLVESINAPLDTELHLENVTIHEFVEKHTELLEANRRALICDVANIPLLNSAKFLDEDGKPGNENEIREAAVAEANKIQTNIKEFVKKMDEWLSDTNSPDYPACKNIIREFFLEQDKLPISLYKTSFHHYDIEGAIEGGSPLNLRKFMIGMPYLKFIAEDKHGLFTSEEKSFILDNMRSSPPTLSYWRETFHYQEPKTISDLKAAWKVYHNSISKRGLQSPLHNDALSNTTIAAATELAVFVRSHKDETHPYSELMAQYPDFMVKAMNLDNKLAPLQLLLSSTGKTPPPRNDLLEYIQKDFKLPKKAKDFAPIYLFLSDSNAIPSEEWRVDFVHKMEQAIAKLPNVDQRIQACEALLLKERNIKDPDIRQQTITLWASACKEKYGRDNNTQLYSDRLEPLINRVAKGAVSTIRYEMLHQLCDTIVSQRNTSHACEKAAYGNLDRDSLTDAGSILGISQLAGDALLNKKKHRERTLEFLIKPLTEETFETIADTVNDIVIPPEDKKDDDLTNHNKRLVRTESRRIYENFWSAPIAARSLVMKALLFPPKERGGNPAEEEVLFTSASTFVMEELLPLTDASGKTIPFAKESREFLKAFLAPGVLDDNQRPLFVAAMISAVQRTQQQGGNIRIGQRLATLLEIMGPAWKKLGQAISSHPDTPRDIAQDMEPLKGKVDMPRWQMWALYENTVPETLREQHPILGPILGSASFFTTVDAGHTVFAMQAPYARDRAADGFQTMERFVQELKTGKYDVGAAVPDSVADMVHSARISAALETNAKVGAVQATAMAKRFNGTSVEIKTPKGSKTYDFEAAQWYNFGPEFRHMKKMPGVIFNDAAKAAETDPDKQEEIHDASKAVVAIDLKFRTDGGASEDDRHGRNFTIDGQRIGMFDFGATHAIIRDKQGNIIEPTDAEKVDITLKNGGTVEVYEPGDKRYKSTEAGNDLTLLGNSLVASLKAMKDKKPLAVAMHEQIEQARQNKQNPEHLIRTERGILSLQDCLKNLDYKAGDFDDIIAGIYNKGGKQSFIHDDIKTILEDSAIQAAESGEFGELSATAKMGLAMAGAMGKKGQVILNHYFDKNAKYPVTILPGKEINLSEPKYWDLPKNKQEIPTLCTEADVAVKKTPKPPINSLSLFPTSRRTYIPMESHTDVAKNRFANYHTP